MKKTKDSEAKLAYQMSESWGQQIVAVLIGIVITLLIVLITLPNESERLINKKCFKQCKTEVDNMGYTMGVLSGPHYIKALRKCHDECAKVQRKTRSVDANVD
jgi:hypothetical protein